MLRQVTAEVQPRLAAQVNSAVSLNSTCMVIITFSHHFCSWCMTKLFSHTFGRRSCRPARYLSSSTPSHISERCLATALGVSSSITTGHYVLSKDVDPKRLDSENNAMKEAQRAHTLWHRWYSVEASLAVASCVFFMKRLFCVCRRSVLYPGSWLKEK